LSRSVRASRQVFAASLLQGSDLRSPGRED
jgi:hypothetical protein